MSGAHWHVGYNMPGYLPENDLHEVGYASHDQAKRALIDEMEHAGDALFNGDEKDAADELSGAMEDLNLILEGEEWSTFPIANVVWYLQSSTESFTCDDDCEVVE
jgi:hypothetical protein